MQTEWNRIVEAWEVEQDLAFAVYSRGNQIS